MKTKHIISFAGLFLASAILFSCQKPDVEIVEFDSTYGLDPSKTEVDIPDPMDYNPNNIVTVSSDPIATVQLFYDSDTDEINGNGEFEVRLRMRRAIDKDLTVNFILDEALLSEYQGNKVGFVDVPDGVADDFSIVIPAGSTEVAQTVSINNITTLKEIPGYLTAFKMEIADAPEDLIASTVGNKVFLKIKVDEASKLELADGDPDGMTLSFAAVNATSDFRSDVVGNVSDGYFDQWFPSWTPGSWWVKNGSDTWLALDFETSNVTGFKIYTLDPGYKSKTIKTFRVEVSSDEGRSYTDYGIITIPDVRRSFSLKFSKPMSINKVRFSEFDGYSIDPNDPWIDIHEIRVFVE